MANKIRQAYEQGLRIRMKGWGNTFFIKKHTNTESIDELGRIWGTNWNFVSHFNKWEIYHEDIHLFKETPDTQPETLIINGIKYKRDDN